MARRRVSRVWLVAALAALWIALLCVLIAGQEQPGDPPGSRALTAAAPGPASG